MVEQFTSEQYGAFIKIISIIAGIETQYKGQVQTKDDIKEMWKAIKKGVWREKLLKEHKEEEAQVWAHLIFFLETRIKTNAYYCWEKIDQVGSEQAKNVIQNILRVNDIPKPFKGDFGEFSTKAAQLLKDIIAMQTVLDRSCPLQALDAVITLLDNISELIELCDKSKKESWGKDSSLKDSIKLFESKGVDALNKEIMRLYNKACDFDVATNSCRTDTWIAIVADVKENEATLGYSNSRLPPQQVGLFMEKFPSLILPG